MLVDLQQLNYPPKTRGRVVVWGYLGSYPFGGMTWQVLHYVAGLRMLGFDVWYVEDTDAGVRDPGTLWTNEEYGPNVDHLSLWMDRIGLSDRWGFRPPGQYQLCLGALSASGLKRLYREADAVINVCGSHELRPDHDQIGCLVYLETDPVQKQVAVARGDTRTIADLSRYRHLFTYGENLGASDCAVPVTHFSWLKTRPPVIPDWWAGSKPPPADAAFTTITSWKHKWNDVEWQGESWRWSKHYEFLNFRALPSLCDRKLELAETGMNDRCEQDFREAGWRLIPASRIADPDRYRDYILGSMGEFTVAKEQYVKPRTGWFSDRSVCYLAAGRPVVTQETGFSSYIPCGEGLFAFSTMDEAARSVNAIAADFPRHSGAAASIAREYFDAAVVVREMMAKVGLV